jgi:hypothetical protein
VSGVKGDPPTIPGCGKGKTSLLSVEPTSTTASTASDYLSRGAGGGGGGRKLLAPLREYKASNKHNAIKIQKQYTTAKSIMIEELSSLSSSSSSSSLSSSSSSSSSQPQAPSLLSHRSSMPNQLLPFSSSFRKATSSIKAVDQDINKEEEKKGGGMGMESSNGGVITDASPLLLTRNSIMQAALKEKRDDSIRSHFTMFKKNNPRNERSVTILTYEVDVTELYPVNKLRNHGL